MCCPKYGTHLFCYDYKKAGSIQEVEPSTVAIGMGLVSFVEKLARVPLAPVPVLLMNGVRLIVGNIEETSLTRIQRT